jgi:hypothetical protein
MRKQLDGRVQEIVQLRKQLDEKDREIVAQTEMERRKLENERKKVSSFSLDSACLVRPSVRFQVV